MDLTAAFETARLVAAIHAAVTGAPVDTTPPPPPAPVVTEDSAAWDCTTMGNRVCGDRGVSVTIHDEDGQPVATIEWDDWVNAGYDPTTALGQHGVSEGGLEVGPADASPFPEVPSPAPDQVAPELNETADPTLPACAATGERVCNEDGWLIHYDENGVRLGGTPAPGTDVDLAQPVDGVVPTERLAPETGRAHVADTTSHPDGIGFNEHSMDDVLARDDVLGIDFHTSEGE